MIPAMLAGPFISFIWRSPSLRRGAIVCVGLALIVSAAEVAVALALVPILVSLGVGSSTGLPEGLAEVPPVIWLAAFAALAVTRSVANWQSAVQTERHSQELVVSLQSRIYRALSLAHWDTVRRLSPPTITSALHTQVYDTSWGFYSLIHIIAAILLVTGYIISAVAVFPVLLLALIPLLVLMWGLNARRNKRVSTVSEDYVDARDRTA